MYSPAIDPRPWTNVLTVFDCEAEFAPQEEAGRWFVLAQAGCNLEEARALVSFTGTVN